ncbi:carbon-nitrogen hydrolase family protein [Paenarthrobacter nicotinovorans]|uniref:carbon-nitrogen hydrolase family protein n=1 Tax=Paenarthrobacter nicotinovorans TaxID=29320 RepID=UPI00380A88BF
MTSKYNGVVRAGVVQAAPVWLDLEGTLDKTISLTEEAARNGAKLLAFPEVWFTGYPHFVWTKSNSAWPERYWRPYFENSFEADSPTMRRLQETAKANAISLVIGFSERDGGSLYISQAVIDETGELLGVRRKFKPTHAERTVFGEGDGSDFRVFNMSYGTLGALSCFEHVQPLIKYTMNGLGEMIHVASWPAVSRPDVFSMGAEIQDTISRMYALENQCFVLSSSQVIDQAGQDLMAETTEERKYLHLGGGVARIYAPDGRDLADHLPIDTDGIIFADLDLSEIVKMKNALDQLGHYSKPNIFHLQVNNSKLRQLTFTRASESARADVEGAIPADSTLPFDHQWTPPEEVTK